MNSSEHAKVQSDPSDDSDDNAPHQDTSPSAEKKVRSSRACIACRRMKTRCEVDEALGSACKLCIRTRRQCVMQSLPRRRTRKTTDRVTDLEKKIEQLTSLLAASESGSHGPTPKSTNDGFPPSDGDPAAKTNETLIDQAIADGLIDWHTACIAFDRYKFQMSRYFPFVVFSDDVEAATVKEQQPLLFCAIAVVGTSSMHSSSKQELRDWLTKDLALRAQYRGERSLELIQALLVLISFYARAKHMRELNFNQMVHTAATMGLDVGLGRRSHKSFPAQIAGEHQLESLAGRRAWLGCYYSATSVSISLRHPAFVRWSVYIEECLDVIANDPHALPSDKWLCDLIKIQHIAEDASVIFSMDDPGSNITLRDVKVQYQLGGFRQQLEQWRRQARPNTEESYVRHVEAVMSLYVHEIALHSEHDIDELRSPLRPNQLAQAAAGVDTIMPPLEDLHLMPARIEALVNCLTAIHAVFDSFLSMGLAMLCTLPNLFFVRTGYAARSLRKLLIICENQAQAGTQFQIDKKDLRFEEYMMSLSETFSRVHAANNSQVARAFSMVLLQMKMQASTANSMPNRRGVIEGMSSGQQSRDSRNFLTNHVAALVSAGQPVAPKINLGEPLVPSVSTMNPVDFQTTGMQPGLAMDQPSLDPNTMFPGYPETATWPPQEGPDAFTSGVDVLQWYGQDFMFDDTSTFGYENPNQFGGWPSQ